MSNFQTTKRTIQYLNKTFGSYLNFRTKKEEFILYGARNSKGQSTDGDIRYPRGSIKTPKEP